MISKGYKSEMIQYAWASTTNYMNGHNMPLNNASLLTSMDHVVEQRASLNSKLEQSHKLANDIEKCMYQSSIN